MKTIVLTGGIGSGKSTVSNILRELGAAIIEADRVSHEIIQPGTPGWQEVVTVFGRGILSARQAIDHKKLAQAVFHNAEALKRLEGILHPKIDAAINAHLQKFRQKGADVVVIEAAVITGADWIQSADYIWVVKSSREITLKRLQARGMSEAESLSRMAFQPPVEEKLKRQLTIIQNDGTREDLLAEVEKLWQEVHN